jgi:hypothetical protein
MFKFSNVDHPFKTTFDFDLIGKDDALCEAEFEKIVADIEAWSREKQVSCEVLKTARGFRVTLHHPEKDGDAFGMSLYLYLSSKSFREMEAADPQRRKNGSDS